MNKKQLSITILMADDDEDDCLLTRESFEEAHLTNDLRFVHDGEELMDHLLQRGRVCRPRLRPPPGTHPPRRR